MLSRKSIPFLLTALMLATPLRGSQDLIFTIKKDGTIEGVRTDSGGVRLLVKFYPKSTWNGHIESVVLKMGKNQLSLPKCIIELFQTQKFEEIAARGFDEFLIIDFNDSGYNKSKEGNRGISIELNLKTAKIARAQVNIINCNGFTNYIPINLRQLCRASDIQPLLDSAY